LGDAMVNRRGRRGDAAYHARMAKLLFSLRNVPDDEAADVRALLEQHGFQWYETGAGLLGFSAPGLWLRDAADYPRARALLDEYQEQRRVRLRAEAQERERRGEGESFLQLLRERPGFVLPRLAAILAVLALTLALPWWLLR